MLEEISETGIPPAMNASEIAIYSHQSRLPVTVRGSRKIGKPLLTASMPV